MNLDIIYNEDCIGEKGIRILPDESIDLTLTDFPYGNGTDYGSYYEDTQNNLQELIIKVMPEILRVSKRALITCGVANIQLFPKSDWILAWVSIAGIGSGKWGFCCWQPILAYGKNPFLQAGLGRRPDIIMWQGKTEKVEHPCPKPLKLWEKILLKGSINEGDIILDPFIGSGTTAIACKRLNRRYIGYEISKEYCQIAKARLEKEKTLWN